MAEQKKCENCDSWHKETESGFGVIPCGGEFIKPQLKSGSCGKHNGVKSAYDTCDDWEPKK
jgi:hypothetical protein